MLFSEPFFLLFFLPILIIIYFIVPKCIRNFILLIASLFFYTVGEKLFVSIMLFSIMINYIIGLLINRTKKNTVQRFFLTIGIIANIGLLFIFKYANFIIDNLNLIVSRLNVKPIEYSPIHLPIGISFFTFQAMSYIIDVYRNNVRSQKNPAKLALYISFFPQLIAGPIVRYSDIAYHLDRRTETFAKFSYGVRRFIIGLGKKMIIANTVALPADKIFSLPDNELKFSIAWFGIICYMLQIYFDFSGYSDMAIGLGRMFGFKFPENFNYPYISKSITEFWRRWHLSLSTWFRDYLYIPLGGNQNTNIRTYINLMIVFLLCGFWHGASWNFVVWGLFHGILLVTERIGFLQWLKKRSSILRHFYVLFAVMISWVFFRAETLSQAIYFISIMFGNKSMRPEVRYISHYVNIEVVIIIIIGVIASTPIAKNIFRKYIVYNIENNNFIFSKRNFLNSIRLFGLILIFIYSILNMASGAYNPFIYFRF